MEWLTTSTILRDLDDRQESAWSELIDHFHQPLVTLGIRMGLDPEEAADAAQESLVSFLQAFRTGRYDRDRGRLSSWLLGFAARTIMQHRKKRRRSAARESPMADIATAPGPSPADSLERLWEGALLAEAMHAIEREVEPATWKAFDLVALRGVPPAEAARELDVSLTAIYSAKHRVGRRLREWREAIDDQQPPSSEKSQR